MDFDNIVEKTKEGIDIVCKKAEQTARISKLKFEIASLEAKRSKNYEELGRITYAESLNAEGHTAIKTARATCIQIPQRRVKTQAQSLRRVARSIAHRTMTRKCHARLQIVSHSTNVAKIFTPRERLWR